MKSYASGRLRFRKSIVMHQSPAMPTIASRGPTPAVCPPKIHATRSKNRAKAHKPPVDSADNGEDQTKVCPYVHLLDFRIKDSMARIGRFMRPFGKKT